MYGLQKYKEDNFFTLTLTLTPTLTLTLTLTLGVTLTLVLATPFLRRCPRRLSTHVPEKAWVPENMFVNTLHPTGSHWKPN